MAYAHITEFDCGDDRSTVNYDALGARLFDLGQSEGTIHHSAGFDDDGVFRMYEVWESRERASAPCGPTVQRHALCGRCGERPSSLSASTSRNFESVGSTRAGHARMLRRFLCVHGNDTRAGPDSDGARVSDEAQLRWRCGKKDGRPAF